MKVKVSRGYDHEGKICHSVSIKQEQFENIPNLSKCEDCTSDCKYYRECIRENQGVVRLFDCLKNKAIIITIWNILTAALVYIIVRTYYKTWHLGFFKGTAALIVTLIALDMFCCAVEMLAEIIRNKYFYNKLKKKREAEQAIEEQRLLAEEAEKIRKQEEENAKNPNRVKIREAESTLNQIEELSDNINFGECDKKVEFCINKCREIIDYLSKDSSGYIMVKNLLQIYLPEFYSALAFYAEFEKAEAASERQKKKLNDAVDYFYEFLCRKNVEAIFDKEAAEIKFNIAADTLKRAIESKGGML